MSKSNNHISETILESQRDVRMRVDTEAAVIRGVKLIGFESRNGRRYPAATLRAAVRHYENTPVNLDHPAKPADSRSVRDRIGVIRGARFVEGQGVFGDFHFNPKHAAAEQIVWDATNNPSIVGFSHNAMLHISRKAGKAVVESIASVRSMDLVADPATTNGFFESVTDDSSATEGDAADTHAEELDMKLADYTLEQILEGRDDLRQLVEQAAEKQRLTEQTDEPPSVEQLQAEVDQLKQENRRLKFAAAVEAELAASLLKTEQVSEPFKNMLLATESSDDRDALIKDREACFRGRAEATGAKTPITTLATEQVGDSLTPELLSRRLRGRAF